MQPCSFAIIQSIKININAIVIKKSLKIMSCYERILCELIISLKAFFVDEDHRISTARFNISLSLYLEAETRGRKR